MTVVKLLKTAAKTAKKRKNEERARLRRKAEKDRIREQNKASDAANRERNRLEARFEKEAIAEFKKQGKVMKKDYFQEDLDKIVNKKMQEYKLSLNSGGLAAKNYVNPVTIVDNRKKK